MKIITESLSHSSRYNKNPSHKSRNVQGLTSKDQRRWNLLICGPIQHEGLVLSQHVKGGLLCKQEFDCTNTILRNINDWGHLFDEVKLVTWTNQAGLISDELKRQNIDIHLLDDPGNSSSFSGDNRIRVMTATAAGLRQMKRKDSCTLRIRSDQSFSLECMIKSHQKAAKLIQSQHERLALNLPHISALCFWLDRPYAVCNYAHAATTSDLLQFAEAQITYRHASALATNGWPEGDAIRKHLYSLRQELRKAGFSPNECFPALPKSLTESQEANRLHHVPKSILRLWEFALKNIYSVSHKKAIKSLYWKDEKYPLPEIFNNGMRFYKKWKKIGLEGSETIYNYCPNTFDATSKISDPMDHNYWLMKERTKLLEDARNEL